MSNPAQRRPICFVAAPIGPEKSAIRERSDKVLEIITRVVDGFGLDAIRADKIAGPGMIAREVIRHLFDDALVIADLTGANPNVYYELALRHAIGKPCIQMIAKGEEPPFDIRDVRTLDFDYVQEFATFDALKRFVQEALQPETVVENPVTAVRQVL